MVGFGFSLVGDFGVVGTFALLLLLPDLRRSFLTSIGGGSC